jgi:NAD(P)-dependent dehydrogenase (short-subunit alcohol dehydrogenase family)
VDLGLEGRTALVTGGSSGVGLAVVQAFVAEGAHVLTVARDADRLRRALAGTATRGGQILEWLACDVLDAPAIEGAVQLAVDRTGGLDVLVCNAGRGRQSRLADTSSEDWRDEVELKLFGILNPLRPAIPHLRRRSGAVVIVNAVLARQPESRMVATSAARAAVLNLARSLAAELAPEIRVNSVLLGLIASGQWRERWRASASGENEQAWLETIARDRAIPLGRFGTPEEVAAAIVFLASARAAYITGAGLEIDGGSARYV